MIIAIPFLPSFCINAVFVAHLQCWINMEIGTINKTDTNTSYNYSYQTTHWSVIFLTIVDTCNSNNASYIRLPLEITTFFLGFPSNVVLLWLLTMGSKALSPSEVLGLNLACLNIIFCLSLPADVYLSTGVRSGQFLLIIDAISVLNIFGCPLLLTSMCVERYLAVAHAVLYMKLASKWQYRAICSILIWISTLVIAGLTLHQTLPKLVLYLSGILNVFLLVMLACLIGIVLELCKKCPGAGQTGPGGGSSMKMRALQNTLLVLFPSFIIYAPLLGLSPFMMTLTEEHLKVTSGECDIMHLFHVYPNLGTCIGPMFYISRVKQLLCQSRHDGKEQSSDQETKQPKWRIYLLH